MFIIITIVITIVIILNITIVSYFAFTKGFHTYKMNRY